MAAPTSASLSAHDTFWADADRHLIRYAGAGAFTREIIDHAAGASCSPRTAARSSTSPPAR